MFSPAVLVLVGVRVFASHQLLSMSGLRQWEKLTQVNKIRSVCIDRPK